MSYYLKEILDLRKNFEEEYNSKRYIEALEDGNRIIELYKENDACNTEAYADDLNNLAIAYDDVHINDKAKELYKEAAKVKKELLGEDSESYMETLSNLGILLSTMGEQDGASDMLKTVSNYMKDNYGINSEKYVRSLYNYGNMLTDSEKYEKAIDTLTEALECGKRVRNLPTGDYEDIHVSIAEACRRYGNYRRARDEYQRAIRISDGENGRDSYFRMTYYLNASMVYQKCELYDKAAELCEKAIAVRERLMDTKHLDFISVLNNLALLYNKNDQGEKAFEVHKRILSLVEDMLGKEHTFYGDVITNLGVDSYIMGDTDAAVKYHKEALEIKKKAVGEKHIHYIWTMISLAEIYEKMEKYDRAVEIQNTALELKRQSFGEVNEQVAESLVSLGRLHIKTGDYEKAQGFLVQALIMSKEIITVGGLRVRGYGENIRLMAEACCELGDKERTEQLCADLILYRENNEGKHHPKCAKALYDGATLLMRLGSYEKAEEYLDRAEAIAEKMLGTDTKLYRDCIYSYCETLYLQGKYAKASEKLKKAASVFKKYEVGNDRLIKLMFMQAKCQYVLGAPKKADEIVFRAEGIASRSDGDLEELMLCERGGYGEIMEKQGDHRQAADILRKVCEEAKSLAGRDRAAAFRLLLACARAELGCGEYQSAAKRAKAAEEYAKNDSELFETGLTAAKALIRSGKYAGAAEELVTLTEKMTKDSGLYVKYASEIFCLLGEAYAAGGDSKKAAESFDKGLAEAKARENLPVDEYMGFLKTASEMAANDREYTKAIEYLSENALLIRRDRGETVDFADILMKAAGMYVIQERYSDAVTMYDKAADIYGDFCGKDSEKRIEAVADSCGAMLADKKYKELAEKIEAMDTNGGRQGEFRSMLASCYRSMGAVGKLIRLKFGGNSENNKD